VARTRFVEQWLGREPELRRRRDEVWNRLEQADNAGDFDNTLAWFGQAAGLVDEVIPAAEVVEQVVRQAEEVLRTHLATGLAPVDEQSQRD
jgi:nitronate monooxygenase